MNPGAHLREHTSESLCLFLRSGNNDFLAEKGFRFKPVKMFSQAYNIPNHDYSGRCNLRCPYLLMNVGQGSPYCPLGREGSISYDRRRTIRRTTMIYQLLCNSAEVTHAHEEHEGTGKPGKRLPVYTGCFFGWVLVACNKTNRGGISSMG